MDSDITMRSYEGNEMLSGDLSDPLFDPDKKLGIRTTEVVIDGDIWPSYEGTTGHQNYPLPEPIAPDKAWAKVYEIARVGLYGPVNREERRRVDKVLRRLAKRGLTIG